MKVEYSKLFLEYIKTLDAITKATTKITIEGELSIGDLLRKIKEEPVIIEASAQTIGE
jgi:hypothetical protein